MEIEELLLGGGLGGSEQALEAVARLVAGLPPAVVDQLGVLADYAELHPFDRLETCKRARGLIQGLAVEVGPSRLEQLRQRGLAICDAAEEAGGLTDDDRAELEQIHADAAQLGAA